MAVRVAVKVVVVAVVVESGIERKVGVVRLTDSSILVEQTD